MPPDSEISALFLFLVFHSNHLLKVKAGWPHSCWCNTKSHIHNESVNSLGRQVRGAQVAGGKKTAIGGLFFIPFIFEKYVLSWQYLGLPEFNLISNLELTNPLFSWKCLPWIVLTCLKSMLLFGKLPFFDSCHLFFGQAGLTTCQCCFRMNAVGEVPAALSQLRGASFLWCASE